MGETGSLNGGKVRMDIEAVKAKAKADGFGRVIMMIEVLPEPARTVLTMRILGSQTFNEIAGVVGKSRDEVQTIYYRNTEMIRKRLGFPL